MLIDNLAKTTDIARQIPRSKLAHPRFAYAGIKSKRTIHMKHINLYILTVLLLGTGVCLALYGCGSGQNAATPPQSTASTPYSGASSPAASVISPAAIVPSLLPDDLNSIQEVTEAVPLDTIPGSITVLVNRKYLLPSSYAPKDLIEPKIRFSFGYSSDKRKLRKEAAKALEKMFRDAEKKKVILYGISGYRSYVRQKQIYDLNVARRGKSATDTVSARPGSSEHQTGLTIDISANSVSCQLSQAFGDTKEGRWVAKNAHKYGYIVRYPYGKSKVTGYHYEPWHIRYVGISVATYLYKNKLTLEEYYHVSCNEDERDTGVDVEEPDKVKFATPKPKKAKSSK